MPDFAYVSASRLLVEEGGAEAREVESAFAAGVARRAASISRRNSWKTQGRGARFQMGIEGLPDELLESRFQGNPVLFTGLCRGRHAAELVYTLSTGAVSGLFAFAGGEEERLFHSADIHVSEPCREPDGERFACVVRGKRGETHIAIVAPGQAGLTEVTAGDAIDSAPCWVPGAQRIVFESRALGYDRNGHVVDVSPSTIQEIDLDKAQVTPLVGSESVSCSSPRITADRTLYYLRRPVVKPRVHLGHLLLSVLLFPFRLILAVFQWFNFFSLRYTGKPLVSSGNARSKQADIKRAAILGNLASAAADARDDEDEVDSPTPNDWQLVARSRSGEEHVVARGVACFDVYPDGSIVWSDGRTLHHRAPSGEEQKIGQRKTVSALIALA